MSTNLTLPHQTPYWWKRIQLNLTFPAIVPQHAHFFNLAQQGSVLGWNAEKESHQWDQRHTCSNTSLLPSLTVVAVVVHQNDLFDQVRWTFLQNASEGDKEFTKGFVSRNEIHTHFRRQRLCASFAHLTTVRSRAERASLWKVMTTLDAGKSDFHCLCLQLCTQGGWETEGHAKCPSAHRSNVRRHILWS